MEENGTEVSYITPVKVQNPYGTCWGFAAIAAAESSLLSSGLAAQKGYDANTLDLLGKQIAWFAANAISDPDNPQCGEGASFRADSTPQDKYHAGGGICFATNLFATGIGPVDESTETEDGRIFAYRGRNGEVNSENVTWIDETGVERSGVRKTSYSNEDDWVIPEQYRFRHNYRLKESYLLPNPASMDGEYHPEATEAIKEQLLIKRAVSITIMATHSVAGEEESLENNYTMSANWAQYCEAGGTNHVVTIVGYDDNYPVENFVKNNQPPAIIMIPVMRITAAKRAALKRSGSGPMQLPTRPPIRFPIPVRMRRSFCGSFANSSRQSKTSFTNYFMSAD